MLKQLVHLVTTVLQRIKKKSLWLIALFKGAILSNLNNWTATWPLIQCALQWSGLESMASKILIRQNTGKPRRADSVSCRLLTAGYRHKQLWSRLTQRHQFGDTTNGCMSDCSWLYSVTLLSFSAHFLTTCNAPAQVWAGIAQSVKWLCRKFRYQQGQELFPPPKRPDLF